MTFDPARAEAAYPDRGLRLAAFAGDPEVALVAARGWIAGVDPEAITYAQHRMISRMMLRHEGRLDGGPDGGPDRGAVVQRLRGVRRQLWTRARLNLALLAPALAALRPLGGDVLVLGTAAALARGAPLAGDGFDLADLLVRGSRFEPAVAQLTAAGWTIAPTQAETWPKARILWLSHPPSGRLRLHRPRSFAGIEPPAIFAGAEGGHQLEGVAITLPAPAVGVRLAVSQALSAHPVADQWLYDLANAADLPGGADLLRAALAPAGESPAPDLRAWLLHEAGLAA